ncbi:MAG TPA: Ppx/GppA phosphatase family protein [Nitrospiraceae bacterium]|nr:Ppx/GppA phosphatase family protein [Nitrospiraceae bacterium]
MTAVPPKQSDGKVLAGVDIGTLTCRLLIARVSNAGRLSELRSDRRILRLGEGVDQARTLRPDAMDRVISTLLEWRKVIETYPVEGQIAVATSAVRDAKNRDEFLGRVKREVGFEVELISGEEEARRTMLGIRSGLPESVSSILGLDIGGGSTEFILDRPGAPPFVRSIDIGVVRLTERILLHDPPTEQELRAVREAIKKETEQVQRLLGDLSGITFVGTAGTITTLAAMAQQLPQYEPARIHNYGLKLATVQKLEQELLSRTKAQRRDMPGLEVGREDVIVAGVLILRTVMETLGYADCLVSDLGLREGVLIDLARRAMKR